MDLTDPAPRTLREFVEHCQLLGQGHWGMWRVVDHDRPLIYGRQLVHSTGRRLGVKRARAWYLDVVCCRCGRGWNQKGWRWARDPSGYRPARWISICLGCLAWWIHIWPEIFPRFRLGIVTYQWRRSELVSDAVPPVNLLDFHQQPPFGPGG